MPRLIEVKKSEAEIHKDALTYGAIFKGPLTRFRFARFNREHRAMRNRYQTTVLTIMLLALSCIFQLIIILAAPGDLDTSFAGTGKTRAAFGLGNDEGKAVVVQPDGRVVVAGSSQNGTPIILVIRYNPDGSLDPSFGGDGIITTTIGVAAICNALAIQSDGKLVVAGSSRNGTTEDFAVVRYNTDGSLDDGGPSDITPGDFFGSGGKVLTAIGTGDDVGNAMALQPDGRVVVAGYSNNGANDDFAIVRYNTDGSLDTSFDGDGKVTTQIGAGDNVGNAVAIQANGRVVVAGASFNGTNFDFAVVRYNTNGSLEATYGTGGKVLVDVSNGGDDTGFGIVLDSLGRAVVVGDAGGLFGVVRLLADTQPGCNYSLLPANDCVPARGGPCSFNVSVGAGCQWTAQTSDSWIVITSDPTGAGNGAVSLEIRDNFTSSARLGTVTLGSETFTVVQEGRGTSCSYTFSPTFAAYQVSGGSGAINITTSSGCGWRAVSTQNWIEITSTEIGIGNATINYTISTNTTGAVRDGAILVGGQSFKVKQKGN
jgi:uncharacterized delta-60 repeat protein